MREGWGGHRDRRQVPPSEAPHEPMGRLDTARRRADRPPRRPPSGPRSRRRAGGRREDRASFPIRRTGSGAASCTSCRLDPRTRSVAIDLTSRHPVTTQRSVGPTTTRGRRSRFGGTIAICQRPSPRDARIRSIILAPCVTNARDGDRRLIEAGMVLASERSLTRCSFVSSKLAVDLTGARYGALGVIARGPVDESSSLLGSCPRKAALGDPRPATAS